MKACGKKKDLSVKARHRLKLPLKGGESVERKLALRERKERTTEETTCLQQSRPPKGRFPVPRDAPISSSAKHGGSTRLLKYLKMCRSFARLKPIRLEAVLSCSPCLPSSSPSSVCGNERRPTTWLHAASLGHFSLPCRQPCRFPNYRCC